MNRIMMFKETYIVGIYDRFTLREERKIGHNLDASSLKHLTKNTQIMWVTLKHIQRKDNC